MFRSTVREIRQKLDNGAFTAKESVNIRLLMERNELRCQLRNYSNLYKELQLKHQVVNNEFQLLQADLDKKTENEQSIMQKKEQAMREEIRITAGNKTANGSANSKENNKNFTPHL